MFPEGENEGLYHTADATLWFFHALDRYVERHAATARRCGDCCRRSRTSSSTTCAARASASASIRRTACCTRAQEGYQLTWMDAKVGDWVVTPRRGKAVEINALWYNALRLMERLVARSCGERRRAPLRRGAEQAQAQLQRALLERGSRAISSTWWTASTATMPACRPNQVFAISLQHPVLRRDAVGAGARRGATSELLTPVGLRSLAPGQPRLQAALLRRPARARRGLSPGDGVGAG